MEAVKGSMPKNDDEQQWLCDMADRIGRRIQTESDLLELEDFLREQIYHNEARFREAIERILYYQILRDYFHNTDHYEGIYEYSTVLDTELDVSPSFRKLLTQELLQELYAGVKDRIVQVRGTPEMLPAVCPYSVADVLAVGDEDVCEESVSDVPNEASAPEIEKEE